MDLCIGCSRCEKVCPVLHAADGESTQKTPQVYAAYSKDRELVRQSSSGAVFSEIAEQVLSGGGAVCGAVCDEQLTIKHVLIIDRKDIAALQGSKYVQSWLGNTFQQVLDLLKEGKQVLFVGTPCQVEGLLLFIPEKYREHLVTMDFVCHGVPSPKVWQKYLHDQERYYHRKALSANFRMKKRGWRSFSLSVKYKEKGRVTQLLERNAYLQAFLRNVILRPSCYDCKFKTIQRHSDFTVADFWKIWSVDTSMYNKMGVSMVIVHTEKGQRLLDSIRSRLVIKEEHLRPGKDVNENMLESVPQPASRQKFFDHLDDFTFNELYKLYVKRGVIYELKNFAKCYLKVLMYYLK
jgi:coenzyme F420-reducing hydrogenase beta subunit